MTYRRVAVVLLKAMVIVAAIAGCLGKESAVQPTETRVQAVQRVNELLREALAQLPAEATTEGDSTLDAVPCDAPTDGGPDGRTFVEREFQILAPASGDWSVTESLPILSMFWEQKGYEIITDNKRFEDLHRYHVQAADGYRLFLQTYDRGDRYDVYLAASSPCVWEFGTPDPQ